MANENNKRFLVFESEGLPEAALQLVEFTGREAISRPYLFEVELVGSDQNIDLEKVLGQPAWIGMKQGLKLADGRRALHTRRIHGVVYDFEQLEMRHDLARYRAHLRPRLWGLGLTKRSRIFLDQDIKQIVEAVLLEHGFSQANEDFEFRNLASHYPMRDYVVQYEETDLDFLHRWLERCGIFYYFEQPEDEEHVGEKLVFVDDGAASKPIAEGASVPYKPEDQAHGDKSEAAETASSDEDWFAEETICAIGSRLRSVPGEVVLSDYNWLTPKLSMVVAEPVVDDAAGSTYEYNNHYQNPEEEGAWLAKVRAEEIRCRRQLFSGKGDCRAFRPGATFDLVEHYRDDWNRRYLLTEIEHRGSQSVALASSGAVGATYDNEFVAIPANVGFRPARVTPWPKITGVMHATTDGPAGAKVAQIDEQGRYKVKLPLDLSDASEGKASRYVRMAQPFAGPGYGMHMPLHIGVEVILAHVDGNPDRPVIVGSVPNPENASPVTAANADRNVIRTASGVMMEFKD